MTKANEIRPGGPAPLTPTLQDKEADKAKAPQQGKISSADQARIAQQAGFHRVQQQKKKGFDVGDSSRAPIPLPEDDTEVESWSPERLDAAQEELTLASTQFGEVEQAQGEVSVAATAVGGSFLPTEDGTNELKKLVERPAPEPLPLEEVTTNVERLFHIKLDDQVPVGHKILATGLVVAGESGSVNVAKGTLNEKKLAGGLKKVTERGNQAVGEAQKMSKGINRELNVQRTFVFKR